MLKNNINNHLSKSESELLQIDIASGSDNVFNTNTNTLGSNDLSNNSTNTLDSDDSIRTYSMLEEELIHYLTLIVLGKPKDELDTLKWLIDEARIWCKDKKNVDAELLARAVTSAISDTRGDEIIKNHISKPEVLKQLRISSDLFNYGKVTNESYTFDKCNII